MKSDKVFLSQLPFYFEKHYKYARDLYPQFISENSENNELIINNINLNENEDSYIKWFNIIVKNLLNSNDNYSQSLKIMNYIFNITKNVNKNYENGLKINFVNKISKNFAIVLKIFQFFKNLEILFFDDCHLNELVLMKIL